MHKVTYIINGDHFDDLEGFYDEITRVLTQGQKWGKNLDAFNDILVGGFGSMDCNEEFLLIWKASDKSKADLRYEETIKQLQKRLERCHESNRLKVKRQLYDVLNNKGTTVYDWLIDIIKCNNNVELILD